jgi:hypothetical protein
MRALSPTEIVPPIKLTVAEKAFARERGVTPDDLQQAHALITLDGRYDSSPIRRHIWSRYHEVLS